MLDIIPSEDTPLKRCPACPGPEGNQWHPATLEYFGRDKWTKDKFTTRCKTCKNAAQKLVKRVGRKIYQFDPSVIAYRRCSECKQEKLVSLENFLPDNHAKYGVSHVCKECWKPYVKRLAEERAAQPQEPMRTCTGPCGQPFPATTEYFAREGPGLRTRCRRCQAKQTKANYKLHEEERKAYRRKHDDANRELVRSYTRNRMALKKKAPGSHTIEDVKRQYDRQKGKCYYCGKKLGTGKNAYHVDHIIPLSRGGSNDISNLVIACPQCNVSKQDKLLHEWLEGGRLL